MAFPTIGAGVVTQVTTATTSPAINMPATVTAGDTLLVGIRVNVGGAIGWPADWNELADSAPDGSGDEVAVAWKKADGTEGGTTVTLSTGNGKCEAITTRITNAADPAVNPPEINTVATGSSVNPLPNAITPSGGAQDYAINYLFSIAGEGVISANPAGWSLVGTATSGTGGATTSNGVHRHYKQTTPTNAATYTPVSATWGEINDWTAYLVAVYPAGAAPPGRTTKNTRAFPLGMEIGMNWVNSAAI